VRKALAQTAEARVLLRTLGRQPYDTLPDIADSLSLLRIEGAHLEPSALRDVASFIDGSGEIARGVAAAEGAPYWAARAAQVADLGGIASVLRRAILPSGELADEASPGLQQIRRMLVRLKSQLHDVMESLLRGREADRLLQDKLVTTRNDRYVLLLKAEHRGQLPGIIHGASGSGASLFVEPLQAVDLNNDIVSLQEEERREVLRILQDLTARVAEHAFALEATLTIMGQLDARQAMALLARDMDAVEPEIVEEGTSSGRLELNLIEARHPLLMRSLTERLGIPGRTSRAPVPVSIRLEPGETALVISGPNTGGKTVALKTVGLLALMAQSGLHIPAAEGSRLPVFRRIYADIGDEQSLAEDLSTFSAHLTHIVSMTADLALPALVLLDELGGGTDPTEGGPLGVAVVDHFRGRGALVMATTHHGLLKAYAQSTPGVACASFDYDRASYEPSYRLVLGTAGRSLALEMAERLGLPASVVQDARSRLDAKEAQTEALLKRLEEDAAALDAERRRLSHASRELEARETRLKESEAAIEARKEREVASFAKELQQKGEALSRQARAAIDEAVRKLEATRASADKAAAKARQAALAEIREAQEAALADPALARFRPAASAPPDLSTGSRVLVKSLGVVGTVQERVGERGEQVVVAISGKKLRVPREELAAASPRSASRSAAPPVEDVTHPAGSAEINLVGMTVDEAVPKVDKLLDEAVLTELRSIRVIHGFGEGRLRKAAALLLEGHPHVASYRLGAEGRGGVPVVELKE
jgi:DNA mismatch repair protein MutS2